VFAAPLGLLALLSLPVVLALHLFRRRFVERRAAGLFLFAPDRLASDAGRRRTRLLNTPSLWLELAAALLLSLLLARPRVFAGEAAPRLVVVLDDSASLAGATADGSSADRETRVLARGAIEEAGRDALVTVVATGPRPEVLAGPSAPPSEALAAIEAWRPRRPDHDPSLALEVALDLGGPQARALYATDRADRPPPSRYRLAALGTPRDNAAIVGARRLRAGALDRVFVDVHAYADAPLERRVAVLRHGATPDAGEVVGERDVRLDPDRTVHLSLEAPAGEGALEVVLSEDALPIDDRVVLLHEPRGAVPVHVGLAPEAAAALELARAVEAAGSAVLVETPQAALLRFVAAPAEALAGLEVVVVEPSGEADAWVGPFLLERHPVLDGVVLEGVVWAAGRTPLPGAPLVLAGEQALLSEERRPFGARFHLNLDPSRSNLPRAPDWPILVGNLVERARALVPGPVSRNVRMGEEIAWRAAGPRDPVEGLVLVAPSGARRPASGIGLATWEAVEPGLHRLLDEDGREVARYAVAFVDAAESDLRVRGRADEPARAGDVVAAEASAAGGADETRVLALLLLLALAADWFVLGRGRR
jgi:hypothetical protein